jgi:hypothetical protein
VSDPVTTARTARESLARGLNALQSDPNIPQAIIELAAPIAQSMGALHQIEKSNGTQLMPHAEVALSNVRAALTKLQSQPATHPAIAQAMEAVAASLGLVHALSKLANAPAAAAPAAAPPAAPFAATQLAPQGAAAPAQQQARTVAQDPFAARPAVAVSASAPAPAGEGGAINADLGAHSVTNFYKGLSGNDIIDHGGLFVSTYMIPKIGAKVRLKVSLPGGYEFEANAVVKWSREGSDSSSDAPPGFGAQFTQITPEARQLVQRYVRNREPLFHDDL